MPLNAAAVTTPSPTHGFASTAPSTSISAATNPTVPGKPTLARPYSKKQTASAAECSYSPLNLERDNRPTRDSSARNVRPRPPSDRITEDHKRRDPVRLIGVCNSNPTSTSDA